MQYRSYSTTINKNKKLNPYWVTGFVDAEGCFSIIIRERENSKMRWIVGPVFQISLHYRDKDLLERIECYFGVGSITKQGENMFQYRVSSINDLKVILNHFDKYPRHY